MNTDIKGGSSLRASNQSGSGPFWTGYRSGMDPPSNSASAAASDPVTNAGLLEFRVSRNGQPPRRLRLTGNRYTFGNADGCSIRLNDAELRPMHAVLIREPAQVVVRTYSVPVEVNGTKTKEAVLNVGDVLRLGVYEFELIAANFAGDGGGARTFGDSAVFSESVLSPPQRNLPPVDEVVWRERLRREVDQWRQRQEDCDRRESRIDEREAELRVRESELWSRSDSLHRRETRIQSQEVETFQLYDEFTQRQQELIQLREESQNRQAELARREAEFREQEFEYRRRLAEANTQLDQSKLQAEAATLAVTRMREQFDALNTQIEQLSKDQVAIENRDYVRREEYERVLQELESAKAEAEQNHEASHRQRLEAEDRVAELTVEIDQLKLNLASDQSDQQAELEESKRIADELRTQIVELQQAVTGATEESTQLRHDYEQSCEKVVQLETLVSESRQRGDEDREQWETETQQLRAEVDRLSSDLTAANQQLEEIRQANRSLNDRLNQVRQERDDARIERDARPTTDAYRQLHNELETANEQLNEIQNQYAEALTKLNQPETLSDISIPKALGLTQDLLPEDRLPGTGSDEEATDAESAASSPGVESTAESKWDTPEDDLQRNRDDPSSNRLWSREQPTTDDVEQSADEGEEEVWPTYQSADIPTSLDNEDKQDVTGDATAATPSDEEVDGVEPKLAITVALQPANESNWGAADATDQTNNDDQADWSASDLQMPDDQPELPVAEAQVDVEDDDSVSEDPWYSAVTTDDGAPDDPKSADQIDDQGSVPPSASAEDLWAPHDEGLHDEIPTSEPDAPAIEQKIEQENKVEYEANAWSSLLEHHSDPADTLAAEMPPDNADTHDDPSDVAVCSPRSTDQGPAWASTESSTAAPDSLEESSSDDPIENSIVQGSLASALIQDLNSDTSDASDLGVESESVVNPADEFPAATHEGTFVMPDGPETPFWADDQIDEVVPPAKLPEASNNLATPEMTSPWDNVSENDGVEMVAESISEHPIDSTGVEDSGNVIAANDVASDEDSIKAEPIVGLAPEDDDSIEAYMNRLLRRVQGDDSLAPEVAIPETISVSSSQSTSKLSKLTESKSTDERNGKDDDDSTGLTQSTPIDNEAPLVPRSQAPERSSNLSAMRDLANSTARSAISRSARVQSRDTQIQAMVSFACAIGALGCNAFAFYFLSGFLLIVAVSMTVIVAFCCFREGAQLMAEARRRVRAANSDIHTNHAETSDH